MYIEERVEIDAPPERVWAVMSDVERWHEWTASITSIQRRESGPLRVGASARVEQPKVPAVVWVVTDLQPGRSFTWVAGNLLFRSAGSHTVEQRAGGGSVATLTVRSRGLLLPLLRSRFEALTREYVALEAAGLKRRCEAG